MTTRRFGSFPSTETIGAIEGGVVADLPPPPTDGGAQGAFDHRFNPQPQFPCLGTAPAFVFGDGAALPDTYVGTSYLKMAITGHMLMTGGTKGDGVPKAQATLVANDGGATSIQNPMNHPRRFHGLVQMVNNAPLERRVLAVMGDLTGVPDNPGSNTCETWDSLNGWVAQANCSDSGAFAVLLMMTAITGGNDDVGDAFRCGGQSWHDTSQPAFTTAQRFNAGINAWRTCGAMNHPRGRHAGVVLQDGRVLVCGGISSSVVSQTSEIYDPTTDAWTNKANMNTPRARHVAVVLQDGRVLVVGGGASSAEIYDPNADTWTAVTCPCTLAINEDIAAQVMDSGDVLCAVGAEAVVFNVGTGKWSAIINLPDGTAAGASGAPLGYGALNYQGTDAFVVAGGTDAIPVSIVERTNPLAPLRPLISDEPIAFRFDEERQTATTRIINWGKLGNQMNALLSEGGSGNPLYRQAGAYGPALRITFPQQSIITVPGQVGVAEPPRHVTLGMRVKMKSSVSAFQHIWFKYYRGDNLWNAPYSPIDLQAEIVGPNTVLKAYATNNYSVQGLAPITVDQDLFAFLRFNGDTGALDLFIGDVLQGTTVVPGAPFNIDWGTSGSYGLGSDSFGGDEFLGIHSDARMWARILSQGDITAFVGT